jgi:hypothetical protein
LNLGGGGAEGKKGLGWESRACDGGNRLNPSLPPPSPLPLQTVSGYHLRVADGVGTLLQMQGMTARLTAIAKDSFMLAR